MPLLIFEITYIKKNFKVNRAALIIGSLLPDLIDKPLLLLGILSGRGIAHTLLFTVIVFVSIQIISKGNYAISVPLLIGILFHLMLDLPGVPLFYPFIEYNFSILEDPVDVWWVTLLTNPIVQITEIIGIAILLFIILRNKLYNFKAIINYLKTNLVVPKEESNKIM